jgi:hypothetical protein
MLDTIPSVTFPSEPQSRTISVINRGNYIVRYKLSYTLNSIPQFLDSGKIAASKNFLFRISTQASNIQLEGELDRGLFTQSKRIFSQNINQLNANLCLATSGSMFSPQVNTCN